MRKMKDSGSPILGEIPVEWSSSRLKYNLVEAMKYGASETGIDYDASLCRYIRITDITSDGKLKEENKLSLANSQANGYILQDKTILFARSGGTVGKSFIYYSSYGKSAFAGYLISAVANERKMLPEWLMYHANSAGYWEWVNQIFTQATIQNIGADKYSNMPIAIAPIEEQKKIVAFLDTKCTEIDALSADIQAEIDTLQEYKRSVITEAVTKGLDKNAPMKDSGISWIGNVPEHWAIYRIADLYCDRNERGNDELPLLTVSINSGVSDKELSDDEQDRVFIRSEDKTKYKRVYAGDITFNMMRAWQGAFGAVRVNGMVSPAYVVAKQTGRAEIDSRYIEALFRSPMGIEEMNRYSYGIMDFRKRLYWPQFRIIKVCLPDIQEQKRIADYIDAKSKEIDEIIGQKQEQLHMLAEYRKSVIYEYVTGKKEVPAI